MSGYHLCTVAAAYLSNATNVAEGCPSMGLAKVQINIGEGVPSNYCNATFNAQVGHSLSSGTAHELTPEELFLHSLTSSVNPLNLTLSHSEVRFGKHC